MVLSRLKALRPDAGLDPRVLHAFTTLVNKIDHQIADHIETGIQRNAYLRRVTLPASSRTAVNSSPPPESASWPSALEDPPPSSNSSATVSGPSLSRPLLHEMRPGAELSFTRPSCIGLSPGRGVGHVSRRG